MTRHRHCSDSSRHRSTTVDTPSVIPEEGVDEGRIRRVSEGDERSERDRHDSSSSSRSASSSRSEDQLDTLDSGKCGYSVLVQRFSLSLCTCDR